MKLSIITPSHRLTHIDELYESIKKQTYKDWEWVLYLNGKAKRNKLSEEIEKDPRVSIYVDYDKHPKSTNVGYIKNKAFNLGKGEILLEVDHDDLITADCLFEVAKAFTENPKAGFVYSHDAIIDVGGVPFSTDYGWANPYQVKWKGKDYWCNGGFTADAGSLSLIFFAPDHIRCWRKSIYTQVGGHNEDLSILDDQELLMRTYLITEFKEIEKCLYLYRVHGENTWLERNQAIQDGTKNLQVEWQRKLATHDAMKNNLEIVNLGNVDFDIHKKWPLADNSVGVLDASHVINQIEDKSFTMSEIYRVLNDKAWAFIEVPSTDGRGAFQDPRHKSYWNENSFWYWTRRGHANIIGNDSVRFQNMASGTSFPNQFFEDNNIPCTWIFLRAKKADTKRPGTTAI
jgi:glycosyltransferase involved in cell wall biosynthesis